MGNKMYMAIRDGLKIFDISKPTKPRLIGGEDYPWPYWPGVFTCEDPDSNGSTLIMCNYVYDVSDPKAPREIGYWDSYAHTSTCVFNCRYAYDSEGAIIDLRNPESPQVVGQWNAGTPAVWAHDLTEVSAGIVVTASDPVMVLDARDRPTRPRVVAVGEVAVDEFVHGVLWPRGGRDRFLLAGGEDLGPRCDVPGDRRQASFVTYNTDGWMRTAKIRPVDAWSPPHGAFIDGNAPVNHFCGHWFDDHPRFDNGGLVAVAWYEHGTRFLRISGQGEIEEEGYYMVPAGEASASYWITDRIVYVADYLRGLDILRYTGKL